MGTLRINFQEGDLPSLHPHDLTIHLRGISISKSLFEGLTRIDLNGKVQLAGADSMEVSSDGLRYTFTLRDNRWSDGTPVTASHYEKAWKEALSPTSTCTRPDLLYALKNGAEAKRGLVPVEKVGVHAASDKKLIVELAYPSPSFLELLAQVISFPILHPKDKQVVDFNGPFALDKWERGQFLRLKQNPHYWNRENVSLRQIEISMMQDMGTVFAAYENGELDWIGAPLSNLSVEQIGQMGKEKTLRSHPVDRSFWIFLNTDNLAFSSPRIRHALSMALDRDKITQHILVGGKPLSKPFPETLLPHAPSKQVHEDLQKAKELFREGLAELGLTVETLPPISISFAQQPNRKELAEYLQDAWHSAFGIKVQLDSQEWNVLRSNLDRGLFEVAGCFEASYYKDPIEVMDRFVNRNPGNFSQWVNPVFTQKIASAKREGKAQKRNEILGEAEQILIDEMPFIPICSYTFFFAHPSTLKGYVFDSLGAIDFSYAKLGK